MPVETLDDTIINTQGLNKPSPRRAKEPREPEKAPVKNDPRQVDDDAPIRMPNPFSGESVESESEPDPVEPEPEQEMSVKDLYNKIFSPEMREITKRILTETDEGKELLDEIGVTINAETVNIDNNQLSSWENECISQLRSSLSPYQEIEELEVIVHLQVNLPVQPFSFLVKK